MDRSTLEAKNDYLRGTVNVTSVDTLEARNDYLRGTRNTVHLTVRLM